MTLSRRNIPILDLKTQYRAIKHMMEESVLRVMASGQYILGPEVDAFEKEFSFFMKSGHTIGVNSGTDALYLALRALGIGAGDEVITTPATFVATAEAIVANGATPVFVDVNEYDSNINADLIEAKITSKTKAILPVHLFGFACDMGKIRAIAEKHNLKVVEDCAQSVGAYWQNGRTGAMSDAGCFSFYPTKNLSAFGDGGAIVTQNEALASRLKALRTHGSLLRGYYDELGVNSRLDEIQATVLRVKLMYVDRWNAMRRRIAHYYNDLLADMELVKPLLPAPGTTPVYCLYCVTMPNRDVVQEHLAKRGIASMVHYPIPLHLLNALKFLGHHEGDFPIAEKLSKNLLALPMYPELTSQEQEEIVEEIRLALRTV